MKIITIPVGPLAANCYVVFDSETKEALVIDPGGEGHKIKHQIEKNELNVKYIVNTHGHADHIGANDYLKKELEGALLAIHESDASMLVNRAENLSTLVGDCIDGPGADKKLKDGDVLEVGKLSFQVIHTPGHTLGGICLLCEEHCFTGDTLFQLSIGRTDLPGGSYPDLIDSIQNKLMKLDDNVIVYPGHGPTSTIGQERARNPYIS